VTLARQAAAAAVAGAGERAVFADGGEGDDGEAPGWS
jgi:hypothetical protein